MKQYYLSRISSQSFMSELIETFERLSFYPLWFSSITGSNVGQCVIDDPSGIGAGIGKMFEYVFYEVCRNRKIPCKIIQRNDSDLIIGRTRFEMKTARQNGDHGLTFSGTGETGGEHKKCGNYILIGYKLSENKVVTKTSKNKGIIREFFYSVNRGVIKTEDWINTGGKTFKLNIPNSKFNKIRKQFTCGIISEKNKYLKCSTVEI